MLAAAAAAAAAAGLLSRRGLPLARGVVSWNVAWPSSSSQSPPSCSSSCLLAPCLPPCSTQQGASPHPVEQKRYFGGDTTRTTTSKFHVSPPSAFQLLSPHRPVDVVVKTGGLESIEVECPSDSFQVERTDNDTVKVQSVEHSAPSQTLRPCLRVSIPERFCSVDIRNAGGSISIEKVVEGTVNITNKCLDDVAERGNIELGQIRGAELAIDTDAGDITAGHIAAETRIDCNRGDIKVQKLLSNSLSLTASGRTDIKVLYADECYIKSAGAICIGTAKLGSDSNMAELTTHVGDISIDGLDGYAKVDVVDTGAVRIQLMEGARRVDIHSNTHFGKVECSVPHIPVVIKAAFPTVGALRIEESLDDDMEAQQIPHDGLFVIRAHIQPTAAEANSPLIELNTLTEGSHATVTVNRRSWKEAMESRMQRSDGGVIASSQQAQPKKYVWWNSL